MTDTEPSENLGGDTPATDGFAEPAGEPATRAEAVVDALGERYWRKHYGGQPALRCLVRTILSQNTSDVASQPAFDRLIERFDCDGDLARSLAEADRADLVAAIESAGLYNRKSRVIQRVSEAILEEWGSAEAFDAFVREASSETVRDRLLAFDGVGPKTADCVLLFASGREGVFPVDTHVHRIARRMGLAPPDGDHETVRDHLESAVPDV